jgi:hypothetical protein
VQTKAILLAREAGLVVPLHPEALSALEERSYLRRSIGATGRLALKPLHVTSHRDDWHGYFLAQRRTGTRPDHAAALAAVHRHAAPQARATSDRNH